MEELENMDDPNQPTVTEELLQIIEEFADYIDKFMFEIVTFLAVVDSSMGLIKDVLGMFGFAGWKMTFFPSFSFVVTIGVFLFGSNKRKGKRKAEAEQLEGLGQAMDMVEDVFEVMDDVMDEIEEVEGEAGALGLGDYSDSDDDDDDDDGIKAETEETSENDDALGKIDVVTAENNQELSQQDVKVEAEPPKSTLKKVIGIAIIAARIASKLAKKKQENQEDQQQVENNDNVGDPGEGNDVGGESMTGANAPPTDDKSKQDNHKTSIQSTIGGLGLGEDGAELKKEAAGLVEAVKEDSLKTAELVKAGSLGANNVVQGGTKQVLVSTGALKVGHGLYREADFITGHLHKEGKATAKSLEKDTKEKTKRIKDNEIVKATGVEKASTAVSREATFIAGHVNQEAKKVIQLEEQGKIGVKQTPSTLESKRSLIPSQKGKKETPTGCKTEAVHPPATKSSAAGRQGKETQGITNSVSLAGTSKQHQSIEIRGPQQGHRVPYETPPKSVEKSFSDLSKTVGDLGEEKQGFEKGRKEASKPLGNQESVNLTESTAVKGGKEPKQSRESEEIAEDPERLIHDPLPGTLPNMASNVMGGAPGAAGAAAAASQAKQGLQQTGKKSKGLLQIAMRLVRLIMRIAKKRGSSAPSSQNSSRRESTASGTGSVGGAPAKGKRSASGGGDGSVPDIAGAASSMAMGGAGAKGGKIGAIVGIVVRLVRLASKLFKGGKQDPSSSDMCSSKESIDQESDSEFFDCDEEFATQEIQTQTEDLSPLLSVATQTTNTAAGSTWKMAARDSTDLTDMRSGPRSTWTARDSGNPRDMRNDPGGTWAARDSGDLRNMRNDPGGTWAPRDSEDLRNMRNDPGGTWAPRDSGDLRNMRNDEGEKDLTRYVKAFQATRVEPNEGPFTESQSKEREEMYQSTGKEMANPKHYATLSQDVVDADNHFFEDQTRELNTTRNDDSRVNNQSLISRELRGPNPQGLRGNDRESTPRRTSTGSLQRITLKILNPTDSSSTEATNNSLLLDIDAPVVLHSTRQFRSPANDVTSTNDVNMVASGNKQNTEEQTPREERSQNDDISREEFPGRRGKSSKSSSVDLDEMEKQSHQTPRAATRRDLRADSREWSERASIVPYSSSSEDLEDFEAFFQRRRPTVVRFEDECEYSCAYDEDEPIASYREMKTRNRTQRRSNGLKKYSSLEKLDYRFPEDRDNGDDGLSVVRDSGCDQESTRLLSEYEKPTLQSSNIFAARKSRLSGSRTSYFGDDEADQPGALC